VAKYGSVNARVRRRKHQHQRMAWRHHRAGRARLISMARSKRIEKYHGMAR